MTAVNALSERFESYSTRYGEQASIKFQEGIKVQDLTIKKVKNKDQHGQTFIFKPSDKYLSVEDDPAIIDRYKLEEWVKSISYLVPPAIKIRFNVAQADGKMYSKKYQNKEGMKELLEERFKRVTDPIHLVDVTHFKEKILNDEGQEEQVDRYTGIEVALAYSVEDSDEYVDSFCNFVNTVDGGTHVLSTQSAVYQVLKDITERSMSESQAKKLQITNADVKNGLKLIIYARTSANPQFSGQVKEKVNSQLLYKQIRPMVSAALRGALRNNDKLVKKVTDIIKANAKARMAADKEKESVIKRSKTEFLDMYDDDKYIPPKVTARHEYKEVAVLEGDSAANAFKSKAFDYQGAIKLRGVSLNAFTAAKAKVLDNKEIRTFIRAGGTGIGEDFKLDKFFFDKVILMPDGDSDGDNIFSTFLAFLLKWMRPLVEAGRVYRSLPPLYKIADKDNPYIKSRKEYFDVYMKNVVKNVEVGNKKQGMLSKAKFRELLENNRDYLEELDRLVRYFGIHPELMEFVLFFMGEKDFPQRLKKRFPEMQVDGKVVRGIYEGKFQYLKLGKRFMRQSEDLLDIIFQPSNESLFFNMYSKRGKELSDRGEFTLGGLMKECLVYKPRIIMRYKGLGELKPEDFQKTVLDPHNRILVKLTVSDIERALETADIFHGKDSSKRQKANSEFRIRRDELDN